jgi:hypothetical protein
MYVYPPEFIVSVTAPVNVPAFGAIVAGVAGVAAGAAAVVAAFAGLAAGAMPAAGVAPDPGDALHAATLAMANRADTAMKRV